MGRISNPWALAAVLALAPWPGWAGGRAASGAGNSVTGARVAPSGIPVPGWGSTKVGALAPGQAGTLPSLAAPSAGSRVLPAPEIAAPASLDQAVPSLALPAPAIPAPDVVAVSPPGNVPEAEGSPEEGTAQAGRLFDGSLEGGGLIEGVTARGARLLRAGKELELLGRGDFGSVYVHPAVRGAVVKLASLSLAASLSVAMPVQEAARIDRMVGSRLAEAGVGPKVFGTASIREEPGFWRRLFSLLLLRPDPDRRRPAVVKERVYGRTVRELMDESAFAQKHYDLIQDMLMRMARARLRVSDLRSSNIMIGSTDSDPAERAYIVDGGFLQPVAPEETTESLYESLKTQRTVPIQAGGGGSGAWGEASYDPLDDILRAGLTRGP